MRRCSWYSVQPIVHTGSSSYLCLLSVSISFMSSCHVRAAGKQRWWNSAAQHRRRFSLGDTDTVSQAERETSATDFLVKMNSKSSIAELELQLPWERNYVMGNNGPPFGDYVRGFSVKTANKMHYTDTTSTTTVHANVQYGRPTSMVRLHSNATATY